MRISAKKLITIMLIITLILIFIICSSTSMFLIYHSNQPIEIENISDDGIYEESTANKYLKEKGVVLEDETINNKE